MVKRGYDVEAARGSGEVSKDRASDCSRVKEEPAASNCHELSRRYYRRRAFTINRTLLEEREKEIARLIGIKIKVRALCERDRKEGRGRERE